eukprot:TRINITY_DN3168_c0_g1_i1.p1 TRINITY_DN3168_c0_g1~~TRINITY_DN3168_c0_g1_i1.p1  ORF type:complete len:136 (+),score=10.32 TRINITY_DN3168_c0_g1_i1:63-470(+)
MLILRLTALLSVLLSLCWASPIQIDTEGLAVMEVVQATENDHPVRKIDFDNKRFEVLFEIREMKNNLSGQPCNIIEGPIEIQTPVFVSMLDTTTVYTCTGDSSAQDCTLKCSGVLTGGPFSCTSAAGWDVIPTCL